MNEKHRSHRQLHPLLRGVLSLIAIVLILLLGSYAIRFCMGLFLTGSEYIVSLPGGASPVVSQSGNSDPDATQPGYIYPVCEATVTAAGDLMMHMPIIESGKAGDTYQYDSIFAYVKNTISQSDYAVVNLETTLAGTENGNTYSGAPQFNCPDAIADSAKTAGFDLLLTGNNHCYDTGTRGLKRTLEVLKSRKLDTLGTSATAEEKKYLVKDVNGIRVGMVNYTFAEIGDNRSQPVVNGLATDASAAGLINAFDDTKLDMFYTEMEAHIANMRADGAEIIVLFIHWGDQLTASVNDSQKAIAQKMCDLGVDVIAGSHSHVVQPMELLTSTADSSHKTICLYSMGNFLSNQRATNISLTTGQSEDGVLFSFSMVKYSDGTVMLSGVDLMPTWILVRGSGDSREYQVIPLDKSVENWAESYRLDSTQAGDAENSFNRTTAVTAEGLDAVQTYLTETRAAWDAALAEIQGVG